MWKKKKDKSFIRILNSYGASNISTICNKSHYINRQSNGKAIKREMEALPFSPKKKQDLLVVDKYKQSWFEVGKHKFTEKESMVYNKATQR